MKCIKSLRAGKDVQVGDIKRVDEKTAYNMVGSSWSYISKTEWKLSRGKKVVKETTEQVTAPHDFANAARDYFLGFTKPVGKQSR